MLSTWRRKEVISSHVVDLALSEFQQQKYWKQYSGLGFQNHFVSDLQMLQWKMIVVTPKTYKF